VRVGSGRARAGPTVDGCTVEALTVFQVSESSGSHILHDVGGSGRVANDLPLLVRITSGLEADDGSVVLDVASGKVHEGTAIGILDRVYVVFPDLRDNPELGGDPRVGELALLISLNLGPIRTGAVLKIHDGTSAEVLDEVDTGLNVDGSHFCRSFLDCGRDKRRFALDCSRERARYLCAAETLMDTGTS